MENRQGESKEFTVASTLHSQLEDGLGDFCCLDGTGLIFNAPIEHEAQKYFLAQTMAQSHSFGTISFRDAGFGALPALRPYLVASTCQITTLIITGKIPVTLLVDTKSCEALADVFLSNKSITTLKIEGGDYTFFSQAATMKAIPSCLKTSTTLRCLSLKGTPLYDDAVFYLADGLANNTSLQELDLASCLLGDRDCSLIAGAVKSHKTLRVLDLSDNDFTRKGLARAYTIKHEGFSGYGHKEIKELLIHNDVLEDLNLEGCDTDFEDVANICEAGMELPLDCTATRTG